MKTILILLATTSIVFGQSLFLGPNGEPNAVQIQILMSKLYPGIEKACSCEIFKLQIVSWKSLSNIKITWKEGTTEHQKSLGMIFVNSFNPLENLKR